MSQDAGLCLPVADSGLCLWLYWESLAMPFLHQHAVLRLDSTCSLPLWDVGIVTSNNSAGMLRVGIPFGKPRARGEYNTPWITAMLSSELRFPQCSVKLFQSLPSLQTLMGSQETSTWISWLVQTFLQGPRMNCCRSAQVTREPERPGDRGFHRGCENESRRGVCSRVVYGLYPGWHV